MTVTRKEIDGLAEDIRKLQVYMVGLRMGDLQNLLNKFASDTRLLIFRAAYEGVEDAIDEDAQFRAKVQAIVKEYALAHPGEITLPCEKHNRLPCSECETAGLSNNLPNEGKSP